MKIIAIVIGGIILIFIVRKVAYGIGFVVGYGLTALFQLIIKIAPYAVLAGIVYAAYYFLLK
jgi:hypothetical protein